MTTATRVELRPSPHGLVSSLRERVEGEVRFDAGSRHLYSTDASAYRQVPIGVVVPRTVEDVIATIEVAREHGAAVTHRGGGTSLAGQTTNAAVVIDWSKYLHHVIGIDPDQRAAWVEPGCVLDELRGAAEEHELTFGPDPATHNRNTLGGMIGNNSCGVHSIMAGRTVDNVDELEILLYDGTRMTVGTTSEEELEAIISEGGRRGEIYGALRDLRDGYADQIRERYVDIPRRVSGFNLDALLPENGFHVAKALIGTEGTCVTVLSAKVRLVESPPGRALLVLGYPTIFEAADHVADIRASGCIGLEAMDQHLVDNMELKGLHTNKLGLLPEGGGWLLVEFGDETADAAAEQARQLMDQLQSSDGTPTMKLYDDPAEEEHVWKVRESGLGATAFVPGQSDKWPGWEDSAVDPRHMGDYLRDFRKLLDDHDLDASLYGHFGDGCLHCRISFDLTSAAGIANYRDFIDKAADLVIKYGGSLSGEHGDGQARAELLPKMFGDDLVRAFAEFKAIWDPDGGMNPGKVVSPFRADENLRLGADHRPEPVDTVFQFPQDGGDFNRAALRCVGVGQCRRDDGHGTMCPSYMVTHEEKHSTRGRARLLFEMLQPESELDGWRDEHVLDALDLCLSCKGCKSDCPVDVDMATYKAEFLHHHFEGRLRPIAAYSLGLIHQWSRIATRVPGLANAALATPGIGTVLKRLAGVAPERPAPAFAGETFRHWFRDQHQSPLPDDAPSVLLWPDTFTDSFDPHIAKAAVGVIEQAGHRVRLPEGWLCCGRPLYDYGMLDLAKRQLRQIVDQLADDMSAGTLVVGLEPSCVATFRDELVNLFPRDADARRLSEQTKTFDEFLVEVADVDLPRIDRQAVVHEHCHQKGTLGTASDEELLDRLGLDWHELDAGCCGLAGSFGFEAGERYELSVAAGERKLVPAVCDAADDTLIIANGFSCRTQIQHLQDRRRALHIAEVIALANDGELDGYEGPVEQRAATSRRPMSNGMPVARAGAAVGAAVAAAAAMAMRRRRR
jgi:FAD/FMN-containing dehydrogenase/Fe-S oxidoreductase